jgi:hypothetical protein
MAKDTVKKVEKALKKGFAAKGDVFFSFTEKSDYKDFVRMYVISDLFRGKNEKERLGEIFEMLETNGAAETISKISLCIAMTNREYEREFGKDVFLAVLGKAYRGMKSRPRLRRLAHSHSATQA